MIQVLSKVMSSSGVGFSTPVLARKECLGTMLFVSPPGTISDAIEAAIERKFPWISVRHAEELQQACAEPETRTRLILIDLRLVSDLDCYQADLAKRHPSAATAIMIDGNARIMESQLQRMGSCLIRGVLPLNVNLDVLLSILHIMLRGGEYFPAAIFRAEGNGSGADNAGGQFNDKIRQQAGGEVMIELTARELEILAKVAKGNQNKIIAADLGLSEHTVKIHIHNIITKLGVHNRTEAAIMYLERTGNDADQLHRAPDD